MLQNLLDNRIGQVIFSIILGLGLAAIFRKVCTGDRCLVVHGPPLKDTKDYYYKVDGDCYKYTPEATKCNARSQE